MSRIRPAQPSQPVTPRGVLCPYCGRISTNPRRCDGCGGFFDPLSRQATQNAMGPWFLRDPAHPFRPGCSYETLRDLIRRGKIRPDTILRGPTTRQFWNFAARTPTVAHLLGICHNCHARVSPDDYSCSACGAVFTPETDRQHMGLAPVHLLPGQAAPEIIAAASVEHPARAARRPVRRTPAPPRQGQAAIEPERRGSAAGKVLLAAGAVVLLAGAGVGAWVLAEKLTEAPTPVTAPVAPPPAPVVPAPVPVGADPATNAAATETPALRPAEGDTGATGGPGAPTGSTGPGGAEPPPPPPEAPKEESMSAAVVPALREGPVDEAALGAIVQQRAPAEAGLWTELIRRRAALLRLRGMP